MQVSDKLLNEYNDYYLNQKVIKKRTLTAQQTINHIKSALSSKKCDSIIDVGAGEGSVIAELDKSSLAKDLYAVEISESGCKCISDKKIQSLRRVEKFDGYEIPAKNNEFDLAIAIHVLEHVEHERIFLEEVSRVGKMVYIEVPLELTLNVRRSITQSSKYGHINYYTPDTFKNLLMSSNLELIDFKVFPNSLEYETFLYGSVVGRVKHAIRSLILRCLPKYAPFLMVYMAGALCVRKS